MGTFGERIYLERNKVAIPHYHLTPALLLQVLSGLGLPFFFYGLYSLNIWASWFSKLGLWIAWCGCIRI